MTASIDNAPVSEAEAAKSEITLATSCWVVCSIGMMVFNKLAIEQFNLSCVLVSLQMIFTVFVMLIGGWRTIHIGSWYDAARWSMVAPLFAGVLLTSMFALHGAPMSLVITFRGLAPIFGLCVEMFYPTPLIVDRHMVFSMVLLLGGVALYISDVPAGSGYWSAIGWVLLNNFFIVADRLLQRLMLSKDQYPVDISKTALTMLCNLFGVVPILIAACYTHEFSKLPVATSNLSQWECLWIFLSCIVGVAISYVGVWTQGLISATTFLMLGTVNKFVVILIEVLIMGEKSISTRQLCGAGMTILAGVAYGKARENIMACEDKAPANEKVPIMLKGSNKEKV